MFKIFKRRTKVQRLFEKYNNLLDQAFELSKKNLMASKDKYYEAELVMIELIEEKKYNARRVE